MATATTRSTPNDSGVYNRGTKKMAAIVALNIGTDDLVTGGGIVPIMELPKEAIVTSIKHLGGDLDSGSNALRVDIGIYAAKVGLSLDELDMAVASTDIEAKDDDIYVDESTVFNGAVIEPAEILGSGTNAVSADDLYKTVRELAGDNVGEEPFKYFLGFNASVSANTPAGADVIFIVEWLQG